MASSDGATLVARGLTAAYGDRQLFSGLDLVVGPGDVVGLVGANGAGKSTMLRLLVTLAAAGDPTAPAVGGLEAGAVGDRAAGPAAGGEPGAPAASSPRLRPPPRPRRRDPTSPAPAS